MATPAPPSKPSFAESLAAHFRAHAGEWIDGLQLERVAGRYAWRTRLSELRREPFRMTIENRQRKETRGLLKWKVSEYRYTPAPVVAVDELSKMTPAQWDYLLHITKERDRVRKEREPAGDRAGADVPGEGCPAEGSDQSR